MLSRAAGAALRFLRRPKSDIVDAATEARQHMSDLDQARRGAEAELDDRPNVYTSSGALDSLIDAFLDKDGDSNNDGVPDADRDGEGLPDAVEDGLDVLSEILAEVEAGAFRGRWDTDGDGEPDPIGLAAVDCGAAQ